MKISGVHHVAIICSNYQKSKHFYVEVLGFEIIHETFRSARNSYKLDLQVGNIQIELFSFPNPPQRFSNPEACGLRHLAFAVENIEESVNYLKSHHIEVENIRIDEITGKKFTFFKDPDNLPLEIYESSTFNLHIREYKPSDTEMIMKLFYDTVHEINIRDYTQEQVKAWAAETMDYEFWHKRLQNKSPYIAENNGEIVGFGELDPDGHIDCFYCHSQYQRKGIGSKLLKHIENIAKSREIKRLYAEVSITAKSFFQHHGFTIVKEQQVERRGVLFTNYLMEKYL